MQQQVRPTKALIHVLLVVLGIASSTTRSPAADVLSIITSILIDISLVIPAGLLEGMENSKGKLPCDTPVSRVGMFHCCDGM